MRRIALTALASTALLAACATSTVSASLKAPVQAQDSYYVKASAAVDARIAERGSQKARNVILFVGDGMGIPTITAARIWAGQSKGVDGESYQLAMEKLGYSAFSKTTERDWESDREVTAAGKAAGCIDIASQFVNWKHGDGMEVVLSGGRMNFLPETMADPEYASQKGARKDGRDLMAEWKAAGPNRTTITDKAGFDAFDFKGDGKVLGLFEPSHMQYEADRTTKDGKGEPSIADMTKAAITRLSKNSKGFVLMVEGGRVDHALHAGNAYRALADAAAMDDAVAAAVAMTDPKETLIIVTADHSHTLMIQGYPERGNPILGLVKEGGKLALGRDGKPYATLGFANGPGSVCKPQADKTWKCDRDDLTNVDTTALDFLQPSLTPLGSETHGGEDVALFASGPGANLFSGTIEQNEIFHVMAKSLRLEK